MTSGTRFLLAARQCEIAELEQLARTSALVGVIAGLVHALQRERGISNVFLGSGGRRFAAQRVEQVAACERAQDEVRDAFDGLDTQDAHARNGSRLFSRVALVLHALDDLPRLRAAIAARALRAEDATAAYDKVVAGLLAVVFEAADAATDPEVSRALVALFNFMQGKEFAGQERAFGARAFAAGRIHAAAQDHWRHLVAGQDACLQVFRDFSDPQVLQACRAGQDADALAQVERMRRLGLSSAGALDAELSDAWYAQCTRRIDGMRAVEDILAERLRQLCARRIAQARTELRDQRTMLEALAAQSRAPAADALPAFGPHLERSVLALVQEQALRLQAMGDELDAARASLNERKLVERAKGLLMAHRRMSEEDAYKALRQMAMNQNRRLTDVAQAVLSLADVLPGGGT
jgi:hypothetical protein